MTKPEIKPQLIDEKYKEMIGGKATPDQIVTFLSGTFGPEAVNLWLEWRGEQLANQEREQYKDTWQNKEE